ncbi:MAG: UDP-N-acetylmuramoyl-L-alanyl-D-glutamate--2,6-diaminopimelate ligase [Pseudohongiellaceae bacterium]
MNTAENIVGAASLDDLVRGLVDLPEDLPPVFMRTSVTGVKMDSRQLQPGDLFLACFGRNHDARHFINYAIKAGAGAVVAESGGDWQGLTVVDNVPVLAVDNLSAKLSEIAGRFYRMPSHAMTVFGITGTNGKTSCSQFIAAALAELGYRCGILGTLGYGPYGELEDVELTTPDPVFTQMALAQMHHEHLEPIAMEVSSVGLHQHRVRALKFDTVIFTNLTRDHLDYHETMESYAENKRKLFMMDGLRSAVVNLDDAYALPMINSLANQVAVYTYSVESPAATIHTSALSLEENGYTATVNTPIGSGNLTGKLLGRFNISNLLAVIAVLISYLDRRGGAADIDTILAAVARLEPVNGRMEIVGSGDITAVVDYAHTPDGLKCALSALRGHFTGRIWCIFGCGGNRDQGKRPMMGEIAEQFADELIIADDNPRNEEGDNIVQHILSGISDRSRVTILRDRGAAIDFAITRATSGDVVLVAGKGHENYQDIRGSRILFSDRNQVRLALQKRGGGLAN